MPSFPLSSVSSSCACLSAAQEELTEESGKLGIWANGHTRKYYDLKREVADLEKEQSALNDTLGTYADMMNETSATTDTFQDALKSCGVSLSDFGDVGDDALSSLESSFNGSLNSIAAECVEQGIRIPQGIADGIAANSGAPSDQAQVVLDAIVLNMAGGDVEAASKALGHDIDQGLVDGIKGDAALPAAAVGIMSDETIAKAKDAFESHSPSQVMYRLGSDVDQGLANGISENSSAPQGAMSSLGSLLIDAISGLPGVSLLTGTSAGANLASGIGGNAGGVQAAGASPLMPSTNP